MKKTRRNKWILTAVVAACCVAAVGAVTAGLNTSLAPEAVAEKPAAEVKPAPKSGAKAATTAESRWVDSVFNSMTPRERVGQLMCPRLDIKDDAAGRAAIRRMVETDHVGGLLLGSGTIEGYRNLIEYAQSIAKVPLLITLDGEWGLNMRVKDAIRYPHSMALGAIGNDSLLYDYGRETARQLRLLGINVNFAPVLDVNSNPSNPVIGFRSFGEDPERVAALATAYSRGLEDGGVMAVAKHFPGHGDTNVDSHKALPTVNHSLSELNAVDLVPFKRFIDAGLSGVMVGHLNVPAVDGSGTPASLSSKATSGLLRKDLGFSGLIFTDALAMKGAAAHGGVNNCVAALEAGADVLLSSGSPTRDQNAVWQALESGRIAQKTVDDRVKRILAYKYRFMAPEVSALKGAALVKAVNSASARDVERRLAAASVVIVRDGDRLLPLRGLEKKRIGVAAIGAGAGNEFSRYCAKYAPLTADVAAAGGTLSGDDVARLKKCDVVIAGVMSDNAAARASLQRLVDAGVKVVPVMLMNPYKMSKFSNSLNRCGTLVAAGDDTDAMRQYAAQAVFGGITVDGRLPVNVKGVGSMGDGVTLKKSRLGYVSAAAAGFDPRLGDIIDSIARACIAGKAMPGCQVLIAKGGDVVVDGAWGNLDYKGSGKVTCETIYDLASVSKATGTLAGVMKAYDEGLFDLDAKASDYIAELKGNGKEGITVKQLLFHESGMPPSLNMYNVMMDTATYSGPIMSKRRDDTYSVKIEDGLWGHKDAKLRSDIVSTTPKAGFDIEADRGIYLSAAAYDTIMANIYRAPLGSKTYRYSCLNFCLLMDMEQRVTSVPHEEWVATEIFGPLGAGRVGYRPTEWYRLNQIAPTEDDNYLRRQTVHGYVHDELANFSGGIQGNAGLFGNAGDLAKLCQMWLNGGTYGGDTILSAETVRLFTRTVSPTCNRGLGFDRFNLTNGRTASGCSPDTYGHTGFTGTCFWVDPDNDIIFVFLSNRVTPTRNNKAFTRMSPRGKLLKAVYDALPGHK